MGVKRERHAAAGIRPHLERLSVGDIEVTYRVAGAGQPVVLVHGLAEDHRSWGLQQAALQDHRTIAYDVRGHGSTTLGDPEGTLAQLGTDLIGLLERIGPATCVGFSLGGTIVLWAASERSDLVRRAIVLGTSSVVGRTAAAFYRSRIELVRSGDTAGFREALRVDTAEAIRRGDVDVDAVTAERLEAVGTGEGYCNAAAAMAGLHGAALTPRLERVRCPVLVVGGEHDTFCPRKAADILVAALPSSPRYVEIPGVGHLMNVDDPDAVTSVVRSWLAGQD